MILAVICAIKVSRNFEIMIQIQDGREARDMVRLTFLLLQLEQKFWWLG